MATLGMGKPGEKAVGSPAAMLIVGKANSGPEPRAARTARQAWARPSPWRAPALVKMVQVFLK